jgi:HSP20 family molecular chaperone IbpA
LENPPRRETYPFPEQLAKAWSNCWQSGGAGKRACVADVWRKRFPFSSSARQTVTSVFSISKGKAVTNIDEPNDEREVGAIGRTHGKPAEPFPEDDVREPPVDVREEEDHLLVTAELPGVAAECVALKLIDDRLDLFVQCGRTTFRKQIDLPKGCSAEQMEWECGSGILKIRLGRRRC